MKILELEDVNSYYGHSHVVQNLSLYVDEGETVSILGRNGVGKTTTLRAIMRVQPPRTSGNIRIDGEETSDWPLHKVVAKGLSYIPSERHIFPGLSVEENLKLAERVSDNEDIWDIERVYGYFPVLKTRRKQDGSTLSGGEQQMLAIGRGLMSNPRIMLLDEPCQGLAPLFVQVVVGIVKDLCKNHNISFLLVEQNYRVALKLASRHYLMDSRAEIKRVCTNEECLENEEPVKKHLCVS
jgi:branched-chain amino acid transport system ATP-binding protein